MRHPPRKAAQPASPPRVQRYLPGMPTTDDLRERRLGVVREHMESENVHEFDVTLATFSHPRYELIATGEVYEGSEEVADYYR